MFEVHDNFVKKTKFFSPRKSQTQFKDGRIAPRFFDDYEHMLSVIGLIRYALCIRENIVESAENIEVLDKDPAKLAIASTILKRQENQVFHQIPFERKEVPHALESGQERHRLNQE